MCWTPKPPKSGRLKEPGEQQAGAVETGLAVAVRRPRPRAGPPAKEVAEERFTRRGALCPPLPSRREREGKEAGFSGAALEAA